MDLGPEGQPPLVLGSVELDEKYAGRKRMIAAGCEPGIAYLRYQNELRKE